MPSDYDAEPKPIDLRSLATSLIEGQMGFCEKVKDSLTPWPMLLIGSASVLMGAASQLLERGVVVSTSPQLAITLVICGTVIIVSGLIVVAFVRLKALSHATDEIRETTRQLLDQIKVRDAADTRADLVRELKAMSELRDLVQELRGADSKSGGSRIKSPTA